MKTKREDCYSSDDKETKTKLSGFTKRKATSKPLMIQANDTNSLIETMNPKVDHTFRGSLLLKKTTRFNNCELKPQRSLKMLKKAYKTQH